MAMRLTLELGDDKEAEFRLLLASMCACGEAVDDRHLAAICFHNGMLLLQSQMTRLDAQAAALATDAINGARQLPGA